MNVNNITTELLVEDMDKALDFYKNILNFKAKMLVPEVNPFFAIIKNNSVELMLYSREQFTKEVPDFESQSTGGTIALYIGVENIKKEHESLKDKVKIIQELHTTDYGTQEFSFYDCNGYVLMLHE